MTSFPTATRKAAANPGEKIPATWKEACGDDGRMPIVLVTGFLGAGKTTALNEFLQCGPRAAVLINEFGQIGIDDMLVYQRELTISLLAGGCACCVVTGDLRATLRNLYLSFGSEGFPGFSRVVLETSGIASPAAIAAELEADPFIRRHYVLEHTLCVVRGSSIGEYLNSFHEAREQVLMADSILVTRDSENSSAVETVQALNPDARLAVWDEQPPDWDWLLSHRLDRCRITGTFQPSFTLQPVTSPAKVQRRSHDFRTLSLSLPASIDSDSLADTVKAFWQTHRPTCLRVKALLPAEKGARLIQADDKDWDDSAMPTLRDHTRWGVTVLCRASDDIDTPLATLVSELESLGAHAQ